MSTWKGAVVLLAILTVFLPQSMAWGQLRTHSGAQKKADRLIHPKDLERRIFQLTNEARRKNGLPLLDQDETLAETARKHSDDMLRRGYFSHTSPDGKTVADRLREEEPAAFRTMSRAGENIYMSYKLDYSDPKTMARVIVDGWMTSAGHRANILNPDYTHLGVGVSAMGKEIMATQNFARRAAPR